MKIRKTIAIDLDEVLSAQTEAIRLFINKRYNLDLTPEDYLISAPYWRYWEKVWGVSEEEGARRVQEFINSGGFKGQKPVKGALQAINRLKKNFNLVIVTSRKDKHAEDTHLWLEEHFPNVFNDIRFSSVWGNKASVAKAKICRQLGANYLIDDNLEHCTLVADEGLIALLFGNYGWSKAKKLPKRVVRVKNWQEVLEYFDETDHSY